MHIIGFIEDEAVIKTIVEHLGLWPVKPRPAPQAHAPPAGYVRDHFSQLLVNDDHFYRDSDCPWDAYIQW